MRTAKVIPFEPRRRPRESGANWALITDWAVVTIALGYLVVAYWFGWWLA